MAIGNTIVFVNGKGGVLKTTGAAHLAGYAATSGWDVLVIDADAQANQSRDLGYVPSDEGSIDGIADVFETAAEVRDVDRLNPDLEVLGAYLGPVQTGATKTERLTRERINMLVNQQDFVFASTIRSARSIAVFCRQEGILSNEYERLAADAKQNRRWWRMSKEEREQARGQHTWSDAAPGLAADWQELVDEIMARFQARLGAFDPAGKTSGV